jgi:hypothetical protein
MRFDWYQTTIEADPRDVLQTIAKLGHKAEPADALARRYRYSQGWQILHDQNGIVAHVFAGGNGDKPHAFASSEATDDFVALVRQEWPDHHLVTRMDAAEDFNDRTAFDRIRRKALKVAKAHRLAFPCISDELNAKAGRTQYIGSPSSDYRGRLYEKGLEQLAKFRDAFAKHYPQFVPPEPATMTTPLGDLRPEDWIRLEVQCRPDGESARRAAATATPEQAWTFTSWSHELAKEALNLDLQRVYIRQRKISKDEETLRWMCQQYGGMLTRVMQDLGDWKAVGLQIGDTVAELHGRKTR